MAFKSVYRFTEEMSSTGRERLLGMQNRREGSGNEHQRENIKVSHMRASGLGSPENLWEPKDLIPDLVRGFTTIGVWFTMYAKVRKIFVVCETSWVIGFSDLECPELNIYS